MNSGDLEVMGYVRVSGLGQAKKTEDGEDERDGFKRQELAIEEFCQARGWSLKHVYREEGVSGTADETQRPAFSEMMAAILGNGVRTVVVERLDRLAREYRIQEDLLIYMAGKGVNLVSADSGENVTEAIRGDPMKKAIIQMQSVFFELERAMLVKKLKAARERKRANGEKVEGALPFGQKLGESEIVKRMLDLRGSGLTPQAIANKLNDEGAKTRMNAKWHRTSVIRVLGRAAETEIENGPVAT